MRSRQQLTDDVWQRTSPLAVLFFLARAFGRGMAGTTNLLSSASGVAIAFQAGGIVWGLIGAAAILALMGVIATLRYWFFRFAVDDGGVRIRRGVFRKTHLDIRFERVQGLDVEEPFIYRLFGLATVTFDTAGSAAREGQLPAITRTFAEVLRERSEHNRRNAATPAADAAPLLRLDGGDMLRIGLTDRSVVASLVTLAVVFQAGNPGRGAALRAAEAAGGQIVALGLWVALLVVAALLIAIGVALLMLTVASAFLRFNDFALFDDGTVLRSRAGLLTRKEVVLERGKVQQLSVSQSLTMRWMGRCRLRALPATSGVASGNSMPVDLQTLNVPILGTKLLAGLRARLFGAEGQRLALHPKSAAFQAISPLYIRARTLAVGVVPALAALAVLLPLLGAAALLALAWPLLVLPATWQAWRRRGYLFDDDGLVSRRGLLGYSVDAFLFRKAQGATVRRSPLQRRKGLASLVVHLASGDITVPYIDFETACRLRDYLLFKAESSRLPWH